MTDDIVEQARYTADNGIPDFTNAPLLRALADEIERLRDLVAKREDLCGKLTCEIERLREQVKYWNGIACEDRAEVERLRECLQSIADAPEQEPDDADWRFRFLEAKRAAQAALRGEP